MTDQEAKDLIAKSSEIWKEAERSIRSMKIKLQRYTGDKTEQNKHISNLDNLLNLSHRQAADINTYSDLLARYLMNIGGLKAQLDEMQRKYEISEQIHEVGVDKVVENYLEMVKRKTN